MNKSHHSSRRTAVSFPAIAFAVCFAAGLVAGRAQDQDKKEKPKEKPAVDAEAAAAQAKWQESITPGDAHKALEAFVGEWNVKSKFWRQPGAPPVESDGTAVSKMIMGGRFVEMVLKSKMMGEAFEGRAITGYDNLKKHYASFWIDNMGTSITTTAGTFSAADKTFTFEGKMDDPMTGTLDKTYRFSDKIISKDEIASEIHDLSLGEQSKVMELRYTRKKKK